MNCGLKCFSCVCTSSNPPKIKHLILFSDRFRLFFFHFSIVMCFVVTKSITLTCCAPFILMGARYYYSSKVIHNYLDYALHTDMADIEAYYMKPTGKTVTMKGVHLFCPLCQLTGSNTVLNFKPKRLPVLFSISPIPLCSGVN